MKWMKLVFRECCGVGEGLLDMRHRDPEPTDGRPADEDIWAVGDAFESVCHGGLVGSSVTPVTWGRTWSKRPSS